MSKSKQNWRDLEITDKFKLGIAVALVAASIILGFTSFIVLLEIPTSVIGLDGLWLSAALAILGISAYFNNQLVKFKAEVRNRLDKLADNDFTDIEE